MSRTMARLSGPVCSVTSAFPTTRAGDDELKNAIITMPMVPKPTLVRIRWATEAKGRGKGSQHRRAVLVKMNQGFWELRKGGTSFVHARVKRMKGC